MEKFKELQIISNNFLINNEILINKLKTVITIYILTKLTFKSIYSLIDKGPRRLIKDFYEKSKLSLFRFLKRIPWIKNKVDKELGKIINNIGNGLKGKELQSIEVFSQLPEKGIDQKTMFELLNLLKQKGQVDLTTGKISGAVYNCSESLSIVSTKAFESFVWSNPLHPELWPSVRKMEAEVISMVLKLYNGHNNNNNNDYCGSLTSGGTESILLTCKAHRDWALDQKGITKPEIVVPVTAHAAFDKAGQYFGIKIIHVAVNQQTCQVDLNAMRKAITSNTIMLVGSAPAFPHGIMDDIVEIARLAQYYSIGCHVDCCLGGFLLPFMQNAGFTIEPFDFRVAGVTSISCDTHKYGFTPKGTSVIMYKSTHLRQYQYFVTTDWPGGVYASPTLAGSRPGSLVATCWATMLSIGYEGYVESTRKIINSARKIAQQLTTIPGIFVFGEPKLSVVAFGSNQFDIFVLGDKLTQLGWNLNRLQFPSSIHICATYLTEKAVDQLINDIKTISNELLSQPIPPTPNSSAALYGLAQSIPDRSLIGTIARAYLDAIYKL
eukprot:TRINITY_DN3221_c1_g1_i1.p1 TRINITY_DN3221_c1_g1~~TRINITY_DN3221_c1_g1_i1.p1  ORF type:complete len:551 (-),score=254.51 TRINITY_DN3221_c1_g1_i1:93-1745(-)